MKKSLKQRIRKQTADIRKAIGAMDYLSSGTLITRTKVCGRPNCRCATDPDARHGPYYEWNRRKDGRLIHRILTREQAELVERAISNQREAKRLLSAWEDETVKEILADRAPQKRRNPS
jgi:hypothetical protein